MVKRMSRSVRAGPPAPYVQAQPGADRRPARSVRPRTSFCYVKGLEIITLQSSAHPESLHCKERHTDLRSLRRQSANRTKPTETWLQSAVLLHTKPARNAPPGVDETWSTNTVLAAHGLRKAAQRNIEELLHHLIADNSAARVDSPSDQPRRLRCFLWRSRVEGIHKDVCIEKEPTAHSARPG